MERYAGEEFLNRLYKDLIHSDEVKHTAKGANKNEDVAIYLDRLEIITDKAINKDKLDLLKYFYYKRYVIKESEVPESYFKMQEQIALERGYGHVTYDEFTKQKEINSIIEEQKESLDIWLEYFSSKDTKHYPMWFKYYVFQSVMKIGYFDKEKNEFTKRTGGTVKPFIEINREAIAMLYDELYKYMDKQEIDDEVLKQLIANGSFNKIYAYIIRKLDMVNKENSNSNEGIWKKYNQGSNPEVLFNDIHGKGTGWCTAGGLETAKSHLEDGDFYVYYTMNNNGEYTNPRIAIRMEFGKIAEIRGVAKEQNLESEMESVVEEKLNEFYDKDQYKKKVSDMKKLTKIYKKHQNKEELTKEELRFLYEIDSFIMTFGYDEDPRVEEIIELRNKKEDLALALGVKENEISLTKKEVLEGYKKCHFGSLTLMSYEIYKLKFPEIIIGRLDLNNITYAENLVLSKRIVGSLDFENIISAKNLILPEVVNGYLDLKSLTSAENLVLPKEINGDLDLISLQSAKGLVLPEKINGDLYLGGLQSAKGLALPKEINGSLNLSGLTSTEGLVLPEKINGSLNLSGLTSAEGLVLPEKINGSLNLSGLTSAENLVLPKEINGGLSLISLQSAKGLVLPEKINGRLYLSSLTNAKNLALPEKINGDLDLRSLQSAKGLVLPEKINGYLDLRSLQDAKGLVLPEKINGGLNLSGLTSAENLVLPKEINGGLNLRGLQSAKGLVLPEKTNGSLNLSGLTSAEGLVLPKRVNGVLDLSNLISAQDMVLPEEVNGALCLDRLTSAEGIVLRTNVNGEYYVPGCQLYSSFDEDDLIEIANRRNRKI